MTCFLVFQHNVAPFCCIVEDEKQICDMVAKSLYAMKEAIQSGMASKELSMSGMCGQDCFKVQKRYKSERAMFGSVFEKIMNMPAKDFAQNILIDTLKAEKLFCGFNYRYGKNGEGSAETLKSFCFDAQTNQIS